MQVNYKYYQEYNHSTQAVEINGFNKDLTDKKIKKKVEKNCKNISTE